jgi:hypothetical protein
MFAMNHTLWTDAFTFAIKTKIQQLLLSMLRTILLDRYPLEDIDIGP